MNGRIVDYMKALAARRHIDIAAECPDWSGVAVFKRVYALYKERGYRLKLLAANNNSHFLWTQFLGGDLIMTINPLWWREMEGASVPVERTIDVPPPSDAVEALLDKLPEYRAIYNEDGLDVADFNKYGAFKNTMREFFEGYDAFLSYLRTFMLPD
jgi:transaldolase